MPKFRAIALIISGGQTGADLAGLLAAERCGIQTGGTAPMGFRTEKGAQPILGSRFGLVQSDSGKYDIRTEKNIIDSDLTLIFSTKPKSSGTTLTIGLCEKHNKNYILIDPFHFNISRLINFVKKNQPSIINIAGNRESISPGITIQVRNILTDMFTALSKG